MKKLLCAPLFALLSCEPPAAVIFELTFNEEVLASPIVPNELILTFCPTATGCQRTIDYQKEIIRIGRALEPIETIAFAPGAALDPQEIFFEFVLLGTNGNISQVIATGSTTQNIGPASYLRRQKISQGLLPGASLQSVQDRTLGVNTRVSIPRLSVHGVASNSRDFLAQAGDPTEFPAHPFFSGITVRSANINNFQTGDCVDVTGTIRSGESGDVELTLEQATFSTGCTNSDPLPVSVNQLQFANEPQVLDGVLLEINDVVIQPCSFNDFFFCALDPIDNVEVEVSDFIFDDTSGNFDATLTNLAANQTPVTIVGAGEMFLGNLFFIVPRNIGDIQP
jgi:hypothetical protein